VSKQTRRLAALFIGVAIVVLGVMPAAWAGGGQGTAENLGIREIDATGEDTVTATFFYQGDRSDLGELAVRVDGQLVSTEAATPLDEDRSLGIVLLIDTSQSMETNAAIVRAKEAAATFVANKAPNDQIAIVTFDNDVEVIEEFTTDEAALTAAIDGLALEPQTALYDGVVRAVGLFEDTELQKNIVLLSDGADTASGSSRDAAAGALQQSGAVLFGVGIEGDDFNPNDVRILAEASGGQFIIADDPSKLETIYSDVLDSLKRQYVVTFPAPEDVSGPVEVTLTVKDQQVTAEYTAGSLSQGAAQVAPQEVAKPSGPAFFRSTTGLWLVILLVLLAVAGVVFSLGDTFAKDRASLSNVLQPYSEGYVAGEDDADSDGKTGMAQTQFIQRAVQMTGDFAERQGILTKVEGMLERANLPLRSAEALFFYLAVVVIVALLATAATANILAGLLGGVLAALLPPAVVNFLGSRRRKQFLALLPDTLQLLSGTLRAGYSLMQGVEAVAQEVSEPMGRELRRVVTESRLGRPLEVSLDAVADRMASPDFAWAVMAIRIQREVGGNLSELLMTVAETMTERERLRRDVAALTAEGKISAIVLGLLPIGLGFAMFAINPEYIKVLFEETIGQLMAVGGVLLALVGFYWMKKVIEIEI
jgi:tight adherence protein B